MTVYSTPGTRNSLASGRLRFIHPCLVSMIEISFLSQYGKGSVKISLWYFFPYFSVFMNAAIPIAAVLVVRQET